MDQVSANETAISSLNLPAFAGFPYLVIRLAPSFYHLIALPPDGSIEELKTLARCQAQMNDLQACLALGHRQGIYFEPDGSESPPSPVPHGGIATCGILKLPLNLAATDELVKRERLLEEYVGAQKANGYAFGDLTKGGRDATPEEERRLAGIQPNGVPTGLMRCQRCGDWRGDCLDPSPHFKGKVMRVHCRCENHNSCAWCCRWLYERKLNANYYSEKDGCIWHVPGFSALRHRCEGGQQWKS